MKVGSQLLSNSSWNAAAFVVGIGLNLMILPFVISRLGVPVFGVAGLVIACIAPTLIFSGSLALMITRELSMRLAPEEVADARRYVSAAFGLGLLVSLVLAIILAFAGPLFAQMLFRLNGELARDLAAAFYFGIAGWVCQCIAGIFLAMFAARQDYARIAMVTISGTLVATVLMLVIIPLWPSASAYMACQAAGMVTNLLVVATLATRCMADWLGRPCLDKAALRSLLAMGKWQAVAQGGGMVSAQADRYMLGMFLQPQNVGYYGIAQRLEEAVYIGVLKVGEILFPFFSTLKGVEDERVGDLFFRAAWVLNVVAVSALGGLVPAAGDLLYLWTGDAAVAAEGQRALVVLALAGILGSASNVFSFYLLARGQTRTLAAISLGTAFFTLITSSAILPALGWPAAGVSSCAGAFAQIVIMSLLLRRNFDMPDVWKRLWHFVLMPVAIGVVIALLLRVWITVGGIADLPLLWRAVALYVISAAVILAAVVACSSVGRYGAICRRDAVRIVSRFIPLRGV